MGTYCLFINIRKCILMLVVVLNVTSLCADDKSLKLLMHSDNSFNQASGTYYWAKEISTYYNSAMGNAYDVGSICGLNQDSQFDVKIVVAGTAGAHVGVKFLPYDKDGTQLTSITAFWNTELSTDYSTLTVPFTVPAQSTYTIKDIYRLRAVVYNIDYSSGAKIWVKSLKLYIDESTLFKNLYLYEYESTDPDVVTKDGELCKELDSGYYTFLKKLYVDGIDIDADTNFEFQIKACGTSNALLGVRATAYDQSNTNLGSFSIMWNKALSSENILQYYNAQFTLASFDVEDVSYLKIYLYRCNQLGTIWFNAPSVYFDYSTINQDIFSKEYASGEPSVELHNSLWARKNDSTYYFSCDLVDFPNKNEAFESSKYEINVLAAGDSTLGVKLQLLDASNNLLESISTGIWGKALTTDYQWHSATFSLPENSSYSFDDIKKARVYIYRSNSQNTIWVNSVNLKCLNDVAEIKYNEIERNLVLDGFSISESNNVLTAAKTDQRDYYEILSDSNDIKKHKYLGTTYTKSSAVASSFPIGVYIYKTEAQIAQLATDWGVTTTQVFQTIAADVADHNCNTIYYSNLSPSPTTFNLAIQQFQTEEISVFGQLNGSSYLRPENGRSYYEATTVPITENLLDDYLSTTGIIGWMGKEECDSEDVPLVQDYRALCKQVDPYHGTFTLHNDLSSHENDILNLPDWFGLDRYRFRELIMPDIYGMMLSTPLYCINTLNNEINDHHWASAKVGRPLIYVGQAYGEQFELDEDLLQSQYGVDINQMSEKSGFVETSPGMWKGWIRYLPPVNAMHLQTWTAIAAGAKGILLYHYFNGDGPSSSGSIKYKALVDDDLTESSQWLEFKNSISSISSLTPLISEWHKEYNSKAVVEGTNEKWITVNSFIRDFDEERYLVIVNKRIGEWDTSSPDFVTDTTQLYYDDNGLAGMTAVNALSFEIEVEGSGLVWDLLSGNQLTENANGKYDVSLDPGRGVVLMQGTQAELTAIRTELGL